MCKTHKHTQTVQTDTVILNDRSEGQCCLTEIFSQEKRLEFAFEGRESGRVPDNMGETVPDVGTKM